MANFASLAKKIFAKRIASSESVVKNLPFFYQIQASTPRCNLQNVYAL
ncbi:MAG TPA: hypothetical protein DCW35_05615 [Polynucleobacter sp.]|nr:hypothetical protein [Polynucleobacter sp.]